ncbi:hypothetical protein [Brachybacterium tyrofermentans]|uniref:hypothetical protein n=1 Tax=Brachybacterium tyrofermentans TaxID=47848 RepID=UPI00186647B6|nr:hypothetical protein [Brachybacterium tyrofermentans]
MSGEDLDELFMHTVTVDSWVGVGAYGDVYADTSDSLPCYLDETRKLVRDENGTETTSEATVFVSLQDGETFKPGSIVHLEDRDALVISRARRDGRPLDLPSHTEVALT